MAGTEGVQPQINAKDFLQQQVQQQVNPFCDPAQQALNNNIFEQAVQEFWESEEFKNGKEKGEDNKTIFTGYFTNKIAQQQGITQGSEQYDELYNQALGWSEFIAGADGEEDLTQADFEDNEEYYSGNNYTVQQLHDCMAGLGTDKETLIKLINNENLTGDDWAGIIKDYSEKYGSDFISTLNSELSGLLESNVRNEIMQVITGKLSEAIENGNEEALDIACQELFGSLGGNIARGIRQGTANEFAQNLINNSSDKSRALILNRYSEVTDSDLSSDIQRCSDISKANKDLMINKLNLASKYNLSDNNSSTSLISELNLDDYGVEDKNKAWTVNLLIENLNNMTTSFQDQNNEDGSVTDDFNIIKSLIGAGISSDDVSEALALQQDIVLKLTEALNSGVEGEFEQAYKELTGVEYDEQKIIESQDKAGLYSVCYSAMQKAQNCQNMLSNANNMNEVLDTFISYYGDEETAIAELNKLLTQEFQDINNANSETVGNSWVSGANIVRVDNEYKITLFKSVSESSYDSNGKLVWEQKTINETLALNEAENYLKSELDNDYESSGRNNFIKDTEGKLNEFLKAQGYDSENINEDLFKQLAEDYQNSKQEAFGNADKFENLVNKYCESQEGFIDKLASITQISGMGLIAVGAGVSFVAPPAGAAIATAGKFMAVGGMFGDNVLDMADNLSSANGLTQEELIENGKETLKEIGYMILGAKINSAAEFMQAESLQLFQSSGMSNKWAQALSWLAEGGTDMGLSILSDMIITGDMNFDQNTLQVLMGILTGVSTAKVNGIKARAQNEEMTKLFSGETSFDESAARLRQKGYNNAELKHFETLYKATAGISQQTISSCAATSVINAINEKPMLVQTLADKFEYNPEQGTLKIDLFGKTQEIKIESGENFLQKVYDTYLAANGDINGDYAIRVFDEMMPGASDILVKPNSDNIGILKDYQQDGYSILTFNTEGDIEGIAKGHSYNVLEIDDIGNMKLQDPITLEETTVLKSQYEDIDCQIAGKTYKNMGLTDSSEMKLTAGIIPSCDKVKIDSSNIITTTEFYKNYDKGYSLTPNVDTKVPAGTVVKIGNSDLLLDDLNLLPGQSITIGRQGDVKIAGDNQISRQHLQVTATENGYIIKDLNSSNGTKIAYSPLVLRHSDGTYSIHKNITLGTFNKLFDSCYSNSHQQSNGDCYLLSTINALYENPHGRNAILNCFSETPDGKVTVKFPNGKYTYNLDTILNEVAKNPRQYSSNNTGLQALEYAFGIERFEKLPTVAKAVLALTGKDEIKYREGGLSKEVMKMFGLNTQEKSVNGMIKYLQDPNNWYGNDAVYTIATRKTPSGGGDDKFWYKDLDLAGNHMYMAKPRLQNGQIVVDIKNPWHSDKISCTLTIGQLQSLGCFDYFSITKVK